MLELIMLPFSVVFILIGGLMPSGRLLPITVFGARFSLAQGRCTFLIRLPFARVLKNLATLHVDA